MVVLQFIFLFFASIIFFIPLKAAQLQYKSYIPELLYATSIKADGKPYDLRTDADIVNDRFHILQGGCTDGKKYAYYCMYNNYMGDVNLNKCKILKVDLHLNDSKVPECVKVSDILELDHGNDMAYISNPDNPYYGMIAVLHCMSERYDNNIHIYEGNTKITIINPETLTIVENGTKEVIIPDPDRDGENQNILPGLDESTKELQTSIIGFDGISYNKYSDEYVILLKGDSGDFLILNNQFEPVRYIKTTGNTGYLNQGIDCVYYDPEKYPASADPEDTKKNYIVLCQSEKDNNLGNILAVYDWDDGQLKKIIKIKGLRYEIENLYHIDDVFYASCYARDADDAQLRFGFLYTFGETENVYGVSLDRMYLKLTPTASTKLTATVFPKTALNKGVIWTSTNPSVAKVSANGLVTALKAGSTTVKARTIEGYYVASCQVKVYKEPAKVPSNVKLKLRVKYKKNRKINKKKSSLTITWKKNGKPTGYRVFISTDKTFTKKWIFTFKRPDKRKVVFRNLKKGKKYYVKVQSFVQYGYNIDYSNFSKVKKVKIKK